MVVCILTRLKVVPQGNGFARVVSSEQAFGNSGHNHHKNLTLTPPFPHHHLPLFHSPYPNKQKITYKNQWICIPMKLTFRESNTK